MRPTDKHDRLAQYRQEHPAWFDQALLSLGADAVDHATHQQRIAHALQGAHHLGATGCPPPEPIDWPDRYVQQAKLASEDAPMDTDTARQLSLEQLLDASRPYSLTLWVKENYAQANFREEGSDGWSIATEPTAAAALHRVLYEYHTRGAARAPIHDPGAERMLEATTPALQAAVRAAPPPIRRTVVVRRAPPKPPAPKPRLVRRLK
jgi:hypothetical protein